MDNKEHITGFAFPVVDSNGYIDPNNIELRKYDYNSLANIPEHEQFVSLPEKDEYKIANNVHVTKKLTASNGLQVDGKTTLNDMIVLSADSFGDSLPTSDQHVAGRIFFVKLQD